MPGALAQRYPISPLPGQPVSKERVLDLARLEREYYGRLSDLDDSEQLVSFCASGHRGFSARPSGTRTSSKFTRNVSGANLTGNYRQ